MPTLMTLMAAPEIAASTWEGGGHDAGPPFPFILVPLFWLLVLAAAAYLFWRWRRDARSTGARAGEAVLAQRYAEGAIDEEEYRTRRAVLREKR